MANEQNLKPVNKRTKSEQREIQRKGGIASGEARRARRTLKAELLLMLSDPEVQEKLSAAIMKKGIDGDIRAFEVIRDTIGEKPTEKVEMKTDMNVVQSAERLRNMFADIKNDRG